MERQLYLTADYSALEFHISLCVLDQWSKAPNANSSKYHTATKTASELQFQYNIVPYVGKRGKTADMWMCSICCNYDALVALVKAHCLRCWWHKEVTSWVWGFLDEKLSRWHALHLSAVHSNVPEMCIVHICLYNRPDHVALQQKLSQVQLLSPDNPAFFFFFYWSPLCWHYHSANTAVPLK